MSELATRDIVKTEFELLACVLMREEVLDLVDLAPDEFFDMRVHHAWKAAQALRADGVPVDPYTIAERVPPRMKGLKADMPTWLSEVVVKMTVTSGHAEHLAGIVRRASIKRRLILGLSEILQELTQKDMSGEEGIGALMELATSLDMANRRATKSMAVIVEERLPRLEEIAMAAQRGEAIPMMGYPIGLAPVDTELGGLMPGLAVIICGRPGMGKSSLAQQLSDYISEQGVGVHVFSLEDLAEIYADRGIAGRARISANHLRTGRLLKGDMAPLGIAIRSLKKRHNWLVDDRSGITAEQVVRSVRKHRVENGTGVVVVDYIQLLRPPKGMERGYKSVSHSIDVLADAAKKDRLVYVVLSQLNRKLESRPIDDRRPMLSDLRESGALEERSKLILGVFRRHRYDKESDPHLAEVVVMKNAVGTEGIVKVGWDGPATRFYDLKGRGV